MQEIIIQIIEQWGYLGVGALIAIENIFPPIPSEVILAFGGFMTTKTALNVVGVIIAATLGSTIGAIVLYLIGKILNKERLERIISGKIGKVLRLKKSDIEKAKSDAKAQQEANKKAAEERKKEAEARQKQRQDAINSFKDSFKTK